MLFVEREYEVEGSVSRLVLQIDEPQFADGEWAYEYRLIGLDEEHARPSRTVSVDKLQALTMTLARISVDLECLSQEFGRITWMGDPRLDLI